MKEVCGFCWWVFEMWDEWWWNVNVPVVVYVYVCVTVCPCRRECVRVYEWSQKYRARRIWDCQRARLWISWEKSLLCWWNKEVWLVFVHTHTHLRVHPKNVRNCMENILILKFRRAFIQFLFSPSFPRRNWKGTNWNINYFGEY